MSDSTTPDRPPAGPASSRAQGPVFTELDARRLGPLRRYFVEHPVVMDWLVSAWFVVPGVLAALFMTQPRWPLVGLVLAGGAALMWRRRAPLWVAGAVGVLGVVTVLATGETGGFELAIAFALYAVAASRPPLETWIVFAVLVLTESAAVLLWMDVVVVENGDLVRRDLEPGQLTGDRVATIVVLALFLLTALAIGTSVRGRRLHLADLIGRANALARDRDQQAQLAVAAERTRIAREMHDVVAHSLTVMVALADGAKASGAKDPELAGQALDELTETGRAALADMRRVLGVLREPDGAPGPAPLAPVDDVAGLEEIVEVFRTAGLPVRLVRSGEQPPLDAALRQASHRIVRESLTNVLRYAPGTPLVVVEVTRRDERPQGGDWLDLRIINHAGVPQGAEGRTPPAAGGAPHGPFGTQVGTGRGIIGMRERAAVYGGAVTAGPSGAGWAVHATLRLDLDAR
ncbi:sensor histidine kinase [Oerskovia flava]|uniref:sensor histidine kinase n=1 Tax=Oerskovia flava TaxID=2986422 RepID=UPI0022400FC5|nr:histidine kinase [Oerskovia sp. JB1-3-2]